MPRLSVLSLALAGLTLAPPAWAQQLALTMRDGRVSISATNVPIRQVLAEWARVGGVTIVNADKVAGPLVTLSLPDVPERQALDALLRGVSGYMVAARPAGRAGASTYDRIFILPTSAVPPPPAGRAVAGQGPGSAPPAMAPRGTMPSNGLQPDPDDSADLSDDGDEPMQPLSPGSGYTRPFPAGFQPGSGGFQPGSGGFQQGVGMQQPGVNGQSMPGQPPNGFPLGRPPFANPAGRPGGNAGASTTGSPQSEPSASNPFGVPAGSGAPGVVTPVPPPPPVRIITNPAAEGQPPPATR